MEQIITGLKDIIWGKKEVDVTSSSSGQGASTSSPSIEQDHMTFGLATVFQYDELRKATNNFDSLLGAGGYGCVYRGKLKDGRDVAVKKLSEESNPKLMEQFINEVTVLSRIRHQNLVDVYGCTDPGTRKLLIVYEFVSNGTVEDHLYGGQSLLSWEERILIAIETADALVYLHSLEPAIIHRDIKTSNILLDGTWHVKVADFGICRLLPWDAKVVSTKPQGTQGYRDPEYDQFFNLTDKSDVYSFGVVLLELISGERALDVHRDLPDIYLYKMAVNKIENKEVGKLVDKKLGYDSKNDVKWMVNEVAKLACACLQAEGRSRPSMVEVLAVLKIIKEDGQHHVEDVGIKDAEVVREGYIFSQEEIKSAVNYSFSPDLKDIGHKIPGKLKDGRMVVVWPVLILETESFSDRLDRMKVISRTSHKNLLTLYGCCEVSERKMLYVFEDAPKGSVYDLLHCGSTFTWLSRIKIAIGTAEALVHLHLPGMPNIGHNLISSDVFVDSAFTAKVAYFYLSEREEVYIVKTEFHMSDLYNTKRY